MSRASKERRFTWLGLVLVIAYVAQAVLGLEVDALVALQADDRYRVLSGALLAAFIAYQWRLGTQRLRDAAGSVARHKLLGAIAPAVLYLHASRFAYGYLLVLGVLYLGTLVVGLLHRPVLAARARALYTWWFVIHVAMSTVLVVVVGYHAVVALAYE